MRSSLTYLLFMSRLNESHFIGSALQIFQKESHPSVYKAGSGNSGAKEGLSLYGEFTFILSWYFVT